LLDQVQNGHGEIAVRERICLRIYTCHLSKTILRNASRRNSITGGLLS
jgi:hypothetical protein